MNQEFDALNITVRTIEGGTLVNAALTLNGQVCSTAERIVTGKPGSQILYSRIRKALRRVGESAFPRMKVVASGDIPGQTSLPGVS